MPGVLQMALPLSPTDLDSGNTNGFTRDQGSSVVSANGRGPVLNNPKLTNIYEFEAHDHKQGIKGRPSTGTVVLDGSPRIVLEPRKFFFVLLGL
ncbi:hypothetical protein RSAG8_09686, partial [Rhizoctonia solani AG-8 WAC10335]